MVDHAVEIFEVKAAAIDEKFARADEIDGVVGLESAEHVRDTFGEGFGFLGHVGHTKVPVVPRGSHAMC
ncbi:hypothetical protein LBMAG48_22170 [Phycisphaerae bacterium]|nr:hypothetical protein LBMAG48_22170 [Phycisphaerae bacterium]